MEQAISDPEDYLLADTREVPNNWRLPLLIYRKVLAVPAQKLAVKFESLFSRHGWLPAWRYGIYNFVHYHSTAHEVIGVFQGRAKVRFGHTKGLETWLEAGDVVVIPAGVSHQCLEHSDDFQGVGAYPKGQEPDMMKGLSQERPAADQRIEKVPLPNSDPVMGKNGPLMRLW